MQETDNKARVGEEKEIDLLELASTLWKQKKKLIKWSLCGALVGLVVAFSIPKEYTTSVKLVPESTEGKSEVSAHLHRWQVLAATSLPVRMLSIRSFILMC